MDADKELELEALAVNVREHVIRMAGCSGCFIGASLSCVDVLVYLYSSFLNISPADPRAADRDYFLLSKGHGVPALYGTLAEMGFLPKDRLARHQSVDDDIYWHPHRNVPGVEFHSGSLGHMPSIGVGIAIDFLLRQAGNRVVVLAGDGELNEGSVWESLLVAGAYHLCNYTLLVDRNRFQANMATEELIPLEPLEDKFKAFGCAVLRTDGHSFADLERAFCRLPLNNSKPSVIICDTIRGKGLPSISNKTDAWFCALTSQQVDQFLEELHGETRSSHDLGGSNIR
jgi:transketolase